MQVVRPLLGPFTEERAAQWVPKKKTVVVWVSLARWSVFRDDGRLAWKDKATGVKVCDY